MNIKEVDKKYLIPVQGKYNKGVFECPFCDFTISSGFYKHIIGIARAYIGVVKVTECPHCFEKYYSHCNDMDYMLFYHTVEEGSNLHFK